jgi:hypothetical protein
LPSPSTRFKKSRSSSTRSISKARTSPYTPSPSITWRATCPRYNADRTPMLRVQTNHAFPGPAARTLSHPALTAICPPRSQFTASASILAPSPALGIGSAVRALADCFAAVITETAGALLPCHATHARIGANVAPTKHDRPAGLDVLGQECRRANGPVPGGVKAAGHEGEALRASASRPGARRTTCGEE